MPATHYGAETAAQAGLSPKTPGRETNGDVRASSFTFNTEAYTSLAGAAVTTDPPNTTVVALCRVPAGAKILGISMRSSAALGAININCGIAAVDGSGVVNPVGPVNDSNTFFGAQNINSTAQVAYADTAANNAGYVTAKDVYITINPAATITAAGVVTGHVLYAAL